MKKGCVMCGGPTEFCQMCGTRNRQVVMSEWVSVKDRLPDNNRMVLMTDLTDMATGNLENNKWWVFSRDFPCMTITHWMELPNLPEEKGALLSAHEKGS